jgi:hypothetical protein
MFASPINPSISFSCETWVDARGFDSTSAYQSSIFGYIWRHQAPLWQNGITQAWIIQTTSTLLFHTPHGPPSQSGKWQYQFLEAEIAPGLCHWTSGQSQPSRCSLSIAEVLNSHTSSCLSCSIRGRHSEA